MNPRPRSAAGARAVPPAGNCRGNSKVCEIPPRANSKCPIRPDARYNAIISSPRLFPLISRPSHIPRRPIEKQKSRARAHIQRTPRDLFSLSTPRYRRAGDGICRYRVRRSSAKESYICTCGCAIAHVAKLHPKCAHAARVTYALLAHPRPTKCAILNKLIGRPRELYAPRADGRLQLACLQRRADDYVAGGGVYFMRPEIEITRPPPPESEREQGCSII